MSSKATAAQARTIEQALHDDRVLAEALAAIRAGSPVTLAGAPEGAWGILAQHASRQLARSVLVVAADPAGMRDDLLAFEGGPRPLLYPAADVLPMDRTPPSDEFVADRLGTQAAVLSAAERVLVVASAAGLMRPAPPPAEFAQGVRRVSVGDNVGLEGFVGWLVEWGYTRVGQVEAAGEIASRGGIVDVFPPTEAGPLRLEFLGDEVESIRGFDISSQASVSRLTEIVLMPAREFPHRAGDVEAALSRLQALDFDSCLPEVAAEWRERIGHLSEAGYFPGVEALYPYLSEAPATLLDYFGAPPIVMLAEPDRVRTQAVRALQSTNELIASEVEHGELPGGIRSGLVPFADLEQKFSAVVSLERSGAGPALGWEPPPTLVGRSEGLPDRMRDELANGQRPVVVTSQPERVLSLVEGGGVPAAEVVELDIEGTVLPAGSVAVIDAGIRTGFRLPDGGIVVYGDHELFGTAPRPRRRPGRVTADSGEATAAFHLEIEPDQLVVHKDHGIGVFRGLRSIGDGGVEREYIAIEYAGQDRVFVPVEHMDRIQLYLGGGEEAPRLSRLGTGDWERTKGRVRRAVAELAGELLETYARREVAGGYAFAPDGPWQAELEAAFPFQETPDQVRAIDEIKRDMEVAEPMDRLLCGDVGFGKTEVALRAAFKAAVDGKQVAVLVPTTVLANQHFMTFTERLAAYPVRVEMLSRFRSDDEAAEVRAGLAAGTVDIVIATHGLLTASTRFKDLGLLVIDEEQRFGVAQKERLKHLRASIDVLSMTATPIPRTLHMSLGGIRDLSVLATPPEERVPIRTFVTADADNLVREVVLRELQRDSQTFFVHNRVRSIARAADRVRQLAPEARVAVAHGQMDERDLAEVMTAFIRRDYDVLVSTTIIESGLDIPTANAILVQDADRFGLADLYQLRGRVGRSGARAYAYFLYDPNRSLTETADKRLDVINEYQELGAGFKLALRDLEIRGAGNLLGREQSGEIAAVGLEMYNQMLRDAVVALRARTDTGAADGAAAQAEAAPERPAVQPLELPLDHFLPHDYVPDERVRLQVYQELAAATEEAQLKTLQRRLKDRFGTPPGPVENLLYSLRVKLAAQAAGLIAVNVDGDALELRVAQGDGRDLAGIAAGHRHLQAQRTRLRFNWRAADDWQEQLLRILGELAEQPVAA
ncbi:MAG: transcription-repair coupling factor [Candidatus Dormiibacterota bacterium]